MTEFVCAACGRDLRLVVNKIDGDGRRWCLSCGDQPVTTPAVTSESLAASGEGIRGSRAGRSL
jgi:hypothetical protein